MLDDLIPLLSSLPILQHGLVIAIIDLRVSPSEFLLSVELHLPLLLRFILRSFFLDLSGCLELLLIVFEDLVVLGLFLLDGLEDVYFVLA